MKARVEVHVQLKPGMLDPQGETLTHALAGLGYESVAGMRVGKWITFDIEGPDAASIDAQIDEMCSRLLANPVIEQYTYHVSSNDNGSGGS